MVKDNGKGIGSRTVVFGKEYRARISLLHLWLHIANNATTRATAMQTSAKISLKDARRLGATRRFGETLRLGATGGLGTARNFSSGGSFRDAAPVF
jgi:hypothetical protein